MHGPRERSLQQQGARQQLQSRKRRQRQTCSCGTMPDGCTLRSTSGSWAGTTALLGPASAMLDANSLKQGLQGVAQAARPRVDCLALQPVPQRPVRNPGVFLQRRLAILLRKLAFRTIDAPCDACRPGEHQQPGSRR